MAEEPLSDLDRRTIGNLPVPRNVPNLTHELRIDPHSQTRADDSVYEHLKDLEAQGYVTNMGSFSELTKVPGALEKHKTALEMPDENADIWVRRLSHPRHEWRADGDLWVVTHDGVEKMRAPTVESPALSPSLVQNAIDSEWARTLKEEPQGNLNGLSLANKMLPNEFAAWAKAISEECERVWNVRPQLPMAGGAGWTDVWENFILDHENQKTSLATNDALTAPWFMALSIFAYTDSDTGATHGDATRLPTYTGYAAKSVAAADMAAAAAGSAANANAITFAACTGGTSNIIGFGNNSTSANTTGIFRKYGACSSTTVSTTQTPATFAVGAYTTTAD